MSIKNKIGVCQYIGRKLTQKDTFVIEKWENQKQLYAVFDGRGTFHISQELKSIFPTIWKNKYIDEGLTAEKIFENIDSDMRNRYPEILTGSTAAVVYVDEAQSSLIAANCGDSKILLFPDAEQLSVDHTCQNEEERKRISQISPGSIFFGKIYAYLYATRSFGNYAHKNLVIPTPHVSKIKIPTNQRLVISSDGLTDVLSLCEIKTIMEKFPDAQQAASELVAEVKNKNGYDNTTVIVVNFE